MLFTCTFRKKQFLSTRCHLIVVRCHNHQRCQRATLFERLHKPEHLKGIPSVRGYLGYIPPSSLPWQLSARPSTYNVHRTHVVDVKSKAESLGWQEMLAVPFFALLAYAFCLRELICKRQIAFLPRVTMYDQSNPFHRALAGKENTAKDNYPSSDPPLHLLPCFV